MVDNTFATPVLQRPLELGADVVLHSTTKYLGGHSDVQGGALVFARRGELCEQVRHLRHVLGAVASPFNSWLVLRGVRTLACRVAAQSATALAVARALEASPAVAAVHYPGLASHPGHEIARRQMSAFGAMLSFHAGGGREAALAGRVPRAPVHPRHLARRRREPDRAPRHQRGARLAHALRTSSASRSASSTRTT